MPTWEPKQKPPTRSAGAGPGPQVPFGPGELWSELQDARLRMERQKAAMASERAETDAVIEDLREQLNVRVLELQELSAREEQNSRDNLELQEAVSDLRQQLAESAEEMRDLRSCFDSSLPMAPVEDGGRGREERVRALEALLDLQRRSELHGHSMEGVVRTRTVFARWRLRTVAASAAITERARLRADGLERLGRAIACSQSSGASSATALLRAFRAWTQTQTQTHQTSAHARAAKEAQGLKGRVLQTWRQLVRTVSSLRQLRWMEPSAVCAPEFAATWQASASRVYRAVLLPSPQLENVADNAPRYVAKKRATSMEQNKWIRCCIITAVAILSHPAVAGFGKLQVRTSGLGIGVHGGSSVCSGEGHGRGA